MPTFAYLFCMLCNFSTKIKVYEFERLFDPTYLNIDKTDPEAWKIYAEKVRDIMAKCMGVPKVEYGYAKSREFEEIYNGIVEKIVERRKFNLQNKKEL